MTRIYIYQRKWDKFLSRIWPFYFVPFINFVLAAGSLAMGDVKEESDFDIIVGAKQGRIFTARFFCYSIFGVLGWRRKKTDASGKENDKFCFSHFVTAKSFRLSPPYNEYWKKLYSSLAPVYGNKDSIREFFEANEQWVGERKGIENMIVGIKEYKSIFRIFLENVLSGCLGNLVERKLKNIQLKRIKRSLESDLPNQERFYKPRIIFNDDELEFHPHTKRIEEFIERLGK